MTRYTVREGVDVYGTSIGIIHIPCTIPLIPGDVGNASTFDFPVLYSVVQGATSKRVRDFHDKAIEAEVADAARRLERQGVRAISSDCGLMVRFQSAVATAVQVPVLLSSLLQLPLALRAVGASGSVAVLAASKERVTPELLALAGVQEGDRVEVWGMEEVPSFREAILEHSGVLDSNEVEHGVVQAVTQMRAKRTNVHALVLECADLPPYSRAIQDATGLPIFDFITMINALHQATHQARYTGDY